MTPADNLAPLDSAANRSKPPLGICCPKCGKPVWASAPKRKRKGRLRLVKYTYPALDAYRRVRACAYCRHKFLTCERIISNSV